MSFLKKQSGSSNSPIALPYARTRKSNCSSRGTPIRVGKDVVAAHTALKMAFEYIEVSQQKSRRTYLGNRAAGQSKLEDVEVEIGACFVTHSLVNALSDVVMNLARGSIGGTESKLA